jgi:hypothetical protein
MKLRDVADVRMGYPFRSRLEHDPRGDVAVIQMKDIDDANLLHVENAVRVLLPKGKDHHLIHQGDLVFRSRGRSNSVALVAANIGDAVLAAPMLLVRARTVLPAYLCWYINLMTTQASLDAIAEGTSVRMISKEALQEIEIPVPSLNRQRQVVELAALSSREQALIAEIAQQRQRLTDGILTRYAKHSDSQVSR